MKIICYTEVFSMKLLNSTPRKATVRGTLLTSLQHPTDKLAGRPETRETFCLP